MRGLNSKFRSFEVYEANIREVAYVKISLLINGENSLYELATGLLVYEIKLEPDGKMVVFVFM